MENKLYNKLLYTHIKKDPIETDIAEARQDLFFQMENFSQHICNVKSQHKEPSFLKENRKNGTTIVQKYVAKSYTLKHSKLMPVQVTVFVGVDFYRSNDNYNTCHMQWCLINLNMTKKV